MIIIVIYNCQNELPSTTTDVEFINSTGEIMETNKKVENCERERQKLILKEKFTLERHIITINDEVELLKIIALQLVDLNTQIRINNL